MTDRQTFSAWCDEPMHLMSLDRLREVHAEIKAELSKVGAARDLLENRAGLAIAIGLCVTLANKRIREWSEGMCM